jgi:hypothetical protein
MAFAEARGQTFTSVVTDALRRHLADPPPQVHGYTSQRKPADGARGKRAKKV